VTALGVVAWASGRSTVAGLLTARAETGVVTETIEVTGRIRPVTGTVLDFGATGRVLGIDVSVGQRVTPGMLLATLDASDLSFQLGQAQAVLTTSQARLVQDINAPAGLDTSAGAVSAVGQQLAAAQKALQDTRQAGQSDVTGSQLALQQTQTVAQGAVNSAQAQAATAQATLADAQQLGLSNIAAAQLAAQQAVASAQGAVTGAQAQVDAARGNLAAAQRAGEQNIAAAQSALQSAQSILHIAEQTLSADRSQLTSDQSKQSTDCSLTPGSNQCIADQQQVRLDQQAVNGDQLTVAQDQAQVRTDQSAVGQAQAAAQQSVSQAQGQLATALAALGAAETALAVIVRTGQNNVVQAQAQAKQATDQAQGQLLAAVVQAQNQQAALQTAVALGQHAIGRAQITAQQSNDQAQSLADAASVQLRTSQAVLHDLQGVTVPQTVVTDEGALQAAQQQVMDAQHNLDGASLVAPIAGVVSEINIAPGEGINQSGGNASNATNTAGPGPAIVNHAIVLSTPGAFEVEATVSDPRLGRVRVGQPVQVRPTGSSQSVPATITSITRVPSTITDAPTYTVTATVDGRTYKLPPGRTAQMTIVVRQIAGAVTVPSSAVITTGPTSMVLLSAGDRVVPRIVEVGARDATRTAIMAGLSVKDSVVVAQSALPALSGAATRVSLRRPLIEDEADGRWRRRLLAADPDAEDWPDTAPGDPPGEEPEEPACRVVQVGGVDPGGTESGAGLAVADAGGNQPQPERPEEFIDRMEDALRDVMRRRLGRTAPDRRRSR
jgi:macrolide-specific efflux system membrane fusion protein